jgi:putative heme-binding domain-containing protein
MFVRLVLSLALFSVLVLADSFSFANDPQIIAGFEVEKVVAVPLEKMGSWVALTADDRGRLICSDQEGSLYRISPPVFGERIDSADSNRIERLNLNIGRAQGLLFVKGNLYVVVNNRGKPSSGLYRLSDTTDDDKFDKIELLKTFQGAGEHGPHGIRLGADGKLYVIAGNATKVPEMLSLNSPHRNYKDDLLEPKGGKMLPGGWIARTDLDAEQWELFCGGFRNPYDLAFNADGELFTFDADSETDIGTAWYRPTRVNHAVSAGEFGWRNDTGKWPDYYADSLGSVVDIGVGSPTGIEFGTGTKFPAKYQRALFIGDWARGTIYAVHMTPSGASYSATFEKFIVGKPLPVTDLVVNKDGALYFTVGGRKAPSALYRVRFTGDPDGDEDAAVERNRPAEDLRQLRRRLEQFHVRQHPTAVDLAWPLLNHPDRSIRFAARLAIENQEAKEWRPRVENESRPTALIQAMLILARTEQPGAQQEALQRLGELPWKQLSEEQMLAALRAYSLAFVRLGGKTPATVGDATRILSRLYPSSNQRVNRELCRLLVYLEDQHVVERSMQLLRIQVTQQDQMFYVFELRKMTKGWSEQHRRAYFSWLQLAETEYESGAKQLGRDELDGRFTRLIQRIRKDAIETLSEDEQKLLKNVIEGRQKVAVVEQETARRFIHNWQVSDLEAKLKEVANGRSFQNGKTAFRIARCDRCHRFGTSGGESGPDLTTVGNRFDARYLLEAMIVPSKVISDQYTSYIITTKKGRIVTGRIIQMDERTTTIRVDPFSENPTVLRTEDVARGQPSKQSEMPKGLINILTQEEIIDLIAYMRSGGNKDDEAFAK